MNHRIKDLTGQKFGKLTVMSLQGSDKHRSAKWSCLCDCGNIKIASTKSLVSGSTQSCGCMYKRTDRIIDLVGQRFGRLLVTKLSEKRYKNNSTMWDCKCDCGKEVTIRRSDLVCGKTVSCGCYKRERTITRSKKPEGVAATRAVYHSYKTAAKRRNLSFELDYETFATLINSDCHYCGSSPINKIQNKRFTNKFLYNGVDRVDSNLGYTIMNVVTACFRCNFAKLDSTIDEFNEWLHRLAMKVIKDNIEKYGILMLTE